MHGYRYLPGVATLQIDQNRCIGRGACVQVCPHRIFVLNAGKALIRDPDLCMECGACARNCPVEAISVTPGVGCTVAILASWMHRLLGKKIFSDCC